MSTTIKFVPLKHPPAGFVGQWRQGMGVQCVYVREKGKPERLTKLPIHTNDAAGKAAAAVYLTAAKMIATQAPVETSTKWFARYVELHAALGCKVTQHLGDWARYVDRFVGSKPMTAITPADIKAIRDNLTSLRLDETIGAKRAANIWSNVIKAPLSRAFTDDDPKYNAVRVGPFTANPAIGIKPPASLADKEEDERERQALDPAEGLALLSCEAIPLSLRRFYAFLMYTGLRPAEAYALTWGDVRLDAQRPHIIVDAGRDMKSGDEHGPKTKAGVRDVPIHPELRAMLRHMKRKAAEHVFPVERVRDVEKIVDVLRSDLVVAGVDRPELKEGTDHLMPFDVRSLRTTFATWCAKAGYDSTWLDVWLGHKPKGTAAKHYVKEVPAFEDVTLRRVLPGTTQPFPPLPADVNCGVKCEAESWLTSGIYSGLLCEGRDLNGSRKLRIR